MEKIVIQEFNDFMCRYNKNEDYVGVKVVDKVDLLGNKYVEPIDECNYLFVINMGINENGKLNLFSTEDNLMEILLRKYIKNIEDGSIYEHGYPESRLIPSNHCEICNDEYLDTVRDEVNDLIESVLSKYFRSEYCGE